jgi:SpoVK/Ycf46/Vps4 family AAA+-type ATPase
LSSTTQLDVQASEQSANRQDKSAAPRGNAFTGGIARNHRDERSNGSAAVDDSADLFEKRSASDAPVRRKAVSRRLGQEAPAAIAKPKPKQPQPNGPRHREKPKVRPVSVSSTSGDEGSSGKAATGTNWKQGSRAPRSTGKLKAAKRKEEPVKLDSSDQCSDGSDNESSSDTAWKKKKASILKNLPAGVDESAAKQILNDIVVQGDEVRWGDIAGLEVAKNALRETVVYPFLRPDLFMGLREPARGMLLFGPPGTGKTMLARAVATESKSTFFSISASSLTSKYLGESEKLVRALFGLARYLAPSIIFVDEIDSLLSQRAGSGEHEATRRIKTEFLIQWSDLQRAAAGRETTERDRERGDANRVLVLAATNLPWAIDEAARRRFVRRQYIPLPEPTTRETQIRTLLGEQKHGLSNDDILKLVVLTDGKSLTVFTRNTSLICT